MKNLSVIFFILPILAFGVVHQVDMVGLAFVPDTLSISEGDSVLWVNTSALFHTTTSGTGGVASGYWDSGLMSPNDSFAFHFDSAGVFPYFCTPHWTLGMVGLINVQPLGVEETTKGVSGSVNFLMAYPNPSARFIHLGYSVNVPGHLQVAVYNSAGQLVTSIMNNQVTTGSYTATWDGKDGFGNRVAPGVYFIGAHLGDEYLQEKVIVLE